MLRAPVGGLKVPAAVRTHRRTRRLIGSLRALGPVEPLEELVEFPPYLQMGFVHTLAARAAAAAAGHKEEAERRIHTESEAAHSS
jgi:hypothetical protein